MSVIHLDEQLKKDLTTQYPFVSGAFDWQLDAFQKLKDKNAAAVLAEVGTGKTAASLYIAAYKFLVTKEIDSLVIFCIKQVYEQWESEQLPQFYTGVVDYEILRWGAKGCKKAHVEAFAAKQTNKLKIFIVNTEALSTKNNLDVFNKFLDMNKCGIILDEASSFKNSTAIRTTNLIYGLAKCVYAGNMLTRIQYKSYWRMILSGSLITKKPLDLYTPYMFLKYSFWNMCETAFMRMFGLRRLAEAGKEKKKFNKYLSPQDIRIIREQLLMGSSVDTVASINGMTIDDVQYIVDHPEMRLPWKNLEKLKALTDPVTYQITLDECFDQVPAVQDERITVEMTAKQLEVYKKVRKEMYILYGDLELSVTNKMVLSMRLAQIAGGFLPLYDPTDMLKKCDCIQIEEGPTAKCTALIESMTISDDGPYLVFCRFRAEVEHVTFELKKAFKGWRVEGITSKVEQKARDEIINDFKALKVDVIVVTPGCLSKGQNMQASNVIYLYSLGLSSDDFIQIRGRIRRATQKKDVCVYRSIVARDTVDLRTYEIIKNDMSLVDYFKYKKTGDVI